MIFYLGKKAKTVLKEHKRKKLNATKSWKYGYNEDIDVVIISKDGTLGEIYEIEGIKIGLPEKPDNEKIINHEKISINQKWEREQIPKELNEETKYQKRFANFIDSQFHKRENGVWIYINGNPIWIVGTYWYGLQNYLEEVEYPKFRVIQNELMIFWEACKADRRCFGMQYVKNRRIGASMLAIIELLESGTINEDKILGIISKKGADAKKIFNRLIKGFKRLPVYFKPLYDGTTTPKKELILDVPTKRRAKNEVVANDGLGSSIEWHNTEINAMDGDAIFRSLVDEAGKYPKDCPFDEYWYIVKTSHTRGIKITGKSMVVSTVNAFSKGGKEYFNIWNDSNVEERDENGQTKSGLYRLFIPAKYCLEGMFDEYGFTIVEDPKYKTKTDEGEYTTTGSVTWLKNKEESYKKDPEGLNEHKRQFPNTIKDAFRNESSDCAFNLLKINEQIEHNDFELEDNEYGNNQVERGNFRWHNGIQDTTVVWTPDPIKGRFWINKDCHPPLELRNNKEKKMKHGVLAWSPTNEHIGCFGVDPYNRTKTADGRGSLGSIHLCTKMNTAGFPNNTFILEYIDRPAKVELFFEDVLMAMVYFSMPMLCELSNERFLQMIKDRGYRHFSLNNPYKRWNELSHTEKLYGGAVQQDAKIGEQQFFAVESYIQDYIGVAQDSSNRPQGEMGNMPFNRTLRQWAEVDVNKRTKYDAYISSSLSLIGNQKLVKKKDENENRIVIRVTRYDNSGRVSMIRR